MRKLKAEALAALKRARKASVHCGFVNLSEFRCLLIFGGRRNPLKPTNDAWVFADGDLHCLQWDPDSLVPPARFRHGITPLDTSYPRTIRILIFGGIGENSRLLDDCWDLRVNLIDRVIRAIPMTFSDESSKPGPRASMTCATLFLGDSPLIVMFGGMTTLDCRQTLYQLDPTLYVFRMIVDSSSVKVSSMLERVSVSIIDSRRKELSDASIIHDDESRTDEKMMMMIVDDCDCSKVFRSFGGSSMMIDSSNLLLTGGITLNEHGCIIPINQVYKFHFGMVSEEEEKITSLTVSMETLRIIEDTSMRVLSIGHDIDLDDHHHQSVSLSNLSISTVCFGKITHKDHYFGIVT